MLQSIKSKLDPVLSGLRIDPRLPMLGMASVAVAVTAAVVIYLWRDQGALRPLYGAGESFPAAQVMEVLGSERIDYRLHPQSGQVLVYDNDLARARLLLAAKGVQVAVPAGYDLFDQEEPLGTSQFVQDVRLKRSLEGELARTIMALDGVDAARVHLAQEQNTSFAISRREPSKASVMLQVRPGHSLQPEQVGAIVNLVAGSVPRLLAADVSVIDQQGALLSRGLDAQGNRAPGRQAIDDYQRQAAASIESVLAPILGVGNYRVSVAADIDFSQKEETLQAYGEAPRLRSERLQDESVLDQLALGVPGSLSNRPATAPAPAETADKAATSLRSESNRQMDYDQRVTHIKHAPYTLRQQSIAVVLNAPPVEEGAVAPWAGETLEQLEALVKRAAGFNEARGDQLSVSLFPFVAAAPVSEQAAWWRDSQLQGLVRLTVGALLALLLLFLVVRPLMAGLLRRPEAASPDPLLLAQASAPSVLPLPAEHQALTQDDPLAEISLPQAGSGLEAQVEHLQMLAGRDPERVSEVIKQWIGRNDANTPKPL